MKYKMTKGEYVDIVDVDLKTGEITLADGFVSTLSFSYWEKAGYKFTPVNSEPQEDKPTAHYQDGSIECVDYLYDNLPFDAFVGGLEWNVKKYLHRWRRKGKPTEDLRKARDYLNVMIDTLEGNKPKFKEFK